MNNQSTILGALIVLLAVIASCTFLVASGDLEADLFMGVVVGPTVGGVVGLVAGVKGVQQGSEATATPPPGA